MTSLTLRDYQREAIDAVFAAWSGGMRRPAIVLPTGAGKTVVFSALVERFRSVSQCDAEQWGGSHASRVIVLAHRDELVDQAIAKLRAVLPEGVSVGKVKAQDNHYGTDVMVCSVQTLASERRREQLQYSEVSHGPVGLIITDECHHAAAASYGKIYDAFPDALHLGVTATLARGDGVGLGSVWDDVVYSRSILWMISKGYLTDVRTKQVDLKALDLGAVKASRGDWQTGDLGRALMEAHADDAIARAWKEHAGDRQGIVFTPTVETAYAACDALRKSGVTATVVDGTTPTQVRREAYEQFRARQTQVLVNCMVLTEGFDAPWAEVAMIARPTQSAPLYTQMVGRVLRPFPGKTEALVLDLVGASANKLRTLVDLEPGVVDVRPGESLAEAAEREEERQTELNRPAPGGRGSFQLTYREVDSFAASDASWIRTPAGVPFINCGNNVLTFLWPAEGEPGRWDVCLYRPGVKWHRTEYRGLEVGAAMAWCEAVAEDYHSGFGLNRKASWRKGEPSGPALNLAFGLGVEGRDRMNAGQLADAISRVKGARIFDRYVRG